MNQEEMIRDVRKRLFEMQDTGYRDFHARLIPTVEKEKIIGIRTPILRKFAKEFGKTEESELFLKVLPHQYYEENNLHGLLIEQVRDYDKCLEELERFLPFIDNWATCDIIALRTVKNHLDIFIQEVYRWIASDHPYIVRFGIGMLMRYYLDDAFRPEYLAWVAAVHSEEYYVNMAIAWYYSFALIKQYERTIGLFEARTLTPWVQNKSIQKAIESYRIAPETKAYLRTLKIK